MLLKVFLLCAYIGVAVSSPNIDSQEVIANPPEGMAASLPNIDSKELTPLLQSIADWILTTNLKTNNITNVKDKLRTSIFINSNLARVLLAAHRISPDKVEYLEEGLAWCDTFVKLQNTANTHDGLHTAGWWDTGYSDLYIADTGTAVTALALCADVASHAGSHVRAKTYLSSMTKFAAFVVNGTDRTPMCTFTPGCHYDSGLNETTSTWLVDKDDKTALDYGSLGDGYYMHKLNIMPYTISTATTGGAFFAEMWALTGRQDMRERSEAAATWIVRQIQPNGTIPYYINPATSVDHTYQCVSYSAEAIIDTDLRFGQQSGAPNPSLNRTITYLLEQQQSSGDLVGENATVGERQRSPRAASLLQWWSKKTNDPRVPGALGKYVSFLQTPAAHKDYGLNQYALLTGFVGLALADLIQPWSTFVSVHPQAIRIVKTPVFV